MVIRYGGSKTLRRWQNTTTGSLKHLVFLGKIHRKSSQKAKNTTAVVNFRKIRAPIKIKSALPPPPKKKKPKKGNFTDMVFPAERTLFFQVSIKLAHPFPAPELRTRIKNGHEDFSENYYAIVLLVRQGVVLSAPKSRDSLRLRRRFLPLPGKSRDFLRPQGARFPLRRRNRYETAISSANKMGKNGSRCGIPCDTLVCGKNR